MTTYRMGAEMNCECCDPLCPVHTGSSQCDRLGVDRLYRVDMIDLDGTLFCEGCADDSIQSGLFE